MAKRMPKIQAKKAPTKKPVAEKKEEKKAVVPKKKKATKKSGVPRKRRRVHASLQQETLLIKDGMEYKRWSSIPEDIEPKEEHIGLRVEIAGKPKSEISILHEIRDDNILVIDNRGAFRAFRKESVILHRDVEVREKRQRVMDIYMSKVKKVVKGKSRKPRKDTKNEQDNNGSGRSESESE